MLMHETILFTLQKERLTYGLRGIRAQCFPSSL